MRPIVFAGLLFLAAAVAAQTTPCPTTPLITVIPGPPVQLTIEHATPPYILDIPQPTIDGREITIRQTPLNFPPPPGPPSTPCNRRTVQLGTLPGGTYRVTWLYGFPSGVPGGAFQPFQTFDFAFTLGMAIPALDGLALAGLMLILGVVGVMLLRR